MQWGECGAIHDLGRGHATFEPDAGSDQRGNVPLALRLRALQNRLKLSGPEAFE